ncbi:MAG: PAS domain S-box protein [Promethearchaeota archaeon]
MENKIDHNKQLDKILTLFNSANDAIIQIDNNMKIIFWNNAAERIFGYSQAETYGKDLYFLLVPEKRAKDYRAHFEIFKEMGKERKVDTIIELEVKTKNGKKILVELSCSAVRIDGKWNALAIIRDITEKKKIQDALEKSEQKYRNLLKLIPDIIYEADREGKITYVNSIGLQKFGYTQEEVERGIYTHNLIAALDLNGVNENLKDLLSGKMTKPQVYLAKRKDGSNFYVRVHSRPIFNGKSIIGFGGILHDITEGKEIEIKLRESEEKFRTLYENIPSGTLIIGENYIIKDVNELTCKITGHTKTELIGQLCDVLCPKGSESKICPIWEVGQEDFEGMDTLIKCKDGTNKPIIKNAKKIELDGKTYILETFLDMSKQKKLEEELKQSEERYRHLFEMSPYGIWIINPFTREIIDCNKTFDHFLSIYTHKDMIGKKFTEAIKLFERPDHFVPLFQERFKTLLKQGYLEPREYNINKADGSNLWITLESTLFLVGGQTRIQAIIKDITQTKNAELQLKASEEKYRHLFEGSPFIIFLLDMQGNLIDYNNTCEKVFFKDIKEDLRGKKLREVIPRVFKVDEALLTLNQERLATLTRGIIPKPLEIELEYVNGKKAWLNVVSSVIDLDGNKAIQTIIQDITDKKLAELKLKRSQEALTILNKQLEEKVVERTRELKESEERLRQQNIELKKLDRLKNDFITMAAHELKTPLISIYGYTDYILTKYRNELESEIENDLLIILRNIQRLRKYMNQLLDVMKIDEDKLKLLISIADIRDIIRDCIHELSYLIKEKRHEVIVDLHGDIRIPVDKERVFQVFSNLISNALKFTPKNGKIMISADQQNDHYRFIIEDNGIGLEEEDLKKLFNKFEMAKHSPEDYFDKDKGTGLGLYIAKGIIEAHGGTIKAESHGKNKGTKFIFTLPIK